jgi:glutathione S-transferase
VTDDKTQTPIRLYGIATSGNTYRVRLFLNLLGLDYEFHAVSGHEALAAPSFRALNAFGEAPVLVDRDIVLRDSQAILVYLARGRGAASWLPETAAGLAAVCQWLSFSANEIQNGPRVARAIALGIIAGDLPAARQRAQRVIDLLDGRLRGRDWLETDRPTVADIACYPYVWNAAEGGVEMAGRPGLREWLGRVERLPGFRAMTELAT